MEVSEIYHRTGLVIEQCNRIEQYLKAIIEAYVLPRDDRQEFFRSHVLNSSIIPFGGKVKLVIAINKDLDLVKLNNDSLHKIMQLRNAFAHNDIISGVKVDLSKEVTDPGAITIGLESISGNGALKYVTRDEAFKEFQNVYQTSENSLKEMLGKLRA